jgi:ribA/ribD-fused uncharacterized protein
MIINDFRHEYGFLTNFHYKQVAYEGITYPTNENAYQAAKTDSLSERNKFINLSPREARNLGQKVQLIADWDNLRYDVMRKLVRQKFRWGWEREALVATAGATLIEGNWWHDNFFGICYGETFKFGDTTTGCHICKAKGLIGQNNLGKIIEDTRAALLVGDL